MNRLEARSHCEYQQFDLISSWIDFHNKSEVAAGRVKNMCSRTPEDINFLLSTGRGVVIYENSDLVGFCGLTYSFNYLDQQIYELGGLIKSPHCQTKGLGLFATLATLSLPKALAADAIFAYAHEKSLPILTVKCEQETGVGGIILSREERIVRFPFLDDYAEDVVVDVTPVVARLRHLLQP